MNKEETQNKVISGVGWSSLASIVNYLLLFTRTFILVRFLAPEDFGLMALSLLLVTVMKQFSHIGLEQAVIQEDNVDQSTINTVWSTSIIRGLLFFGLINIFCPYYADYFNEPELKTILPILSCAAIFNGFKNSYVVLAQKALKFDVLFKLTVIANIVEFIITVTLAVIYGNVIALVMGYLAGSIAALILSFTLFHRRPNFVFNTSEFLKLFKFGKWVFSGGILIFLILNIDTTVIGKVLGTAMLGYYTIAFRFANFAATDIVLTFSKSLYPSFSLVKNDLTLLKDYFLTTVLIISIVVLPIMMILGFYAESFVLYFLGSDWEQVILPLKILVVFGIVRSFASVCGFIFWAVGKPKIQSGISFLQLVLILIIILPLTSNYNIAGTALAVTIPLFVSSLISFYYVGLELKINIYDLFSYLRSTFLAGVCLLSLIIFMQWYFQSIPSTLIFLLNGAVLCSIYLILLFLFDYFSGKKIIGITKNVVNHFNRNNLTRSAN